MVSFEVGVGFCGYFLDLFFDFFNVDWVVWCGGNEDFFLIGVIKIVCVMFEL